MAMVLARRILNSVSVSAAAAGAARSESRRATVRSDRICRQSYHAATGSLTAPRPGATLASFSPLTGSQATEASYGEASGSGEHRGGLPRAAGRARYRVSLRQRGHGLRAPHRGVRQAGRAGADEPAAADHPEREASRGRGPRLHHGIGTTAG